MTTTPSGEPPRQRGERGEPGPGYGRVLAALAVASVLWGLAVAVVPVDARVPVAWCAGVAGVLVCATVAVSDHRVRRAEERAARHRAAAEHAQRDLASIREETARLHADTLPWVLHRLDQRASAATILADGDDRMPRDPALRVLLEQVVHNLAQERHRLNAVVEVMQESAQRVYAGVTAQLAELSERQERYWQEQTAVVPRAEIRRDFQALDKGLAPLGMLTLRLLALLGARRIGRAWPRPVALRRVLRAAKGSTEDYQRVQDPLSSPVAVASQAVNATVHVLAEVLDNALRFSPPTTRVWVTSEDASAGTVLHVDDSGLTMPPETREWARRIVDLDQPLAISALSGRRLGLAAARCSAEPHGIRLTFGTSPSGGTRVSILLPNHLLTREHVRDHAAPAAEATAPAAPAAEATAPAAAPVADTPAPPSPAGEGSALPQRRPGATLSETPTGPKPEPPPPPRPAQETTTRLSAFHRASRPSLPDVSPSEESHDASADD